MSSSRDPSALRVEPTPALGAQGRIRVELPHWAAFVEIHNHDLNRVDDASIDESGEDLVVCARLPPGVYQVAVALSGASKGEWVSVLAGHTVTLPVDLWAGLGVFGPAAGRAASGSSLQMVEAIQQASRQPPRPAFGGGGSSLLVFLDSEGRSARSLLRGLTLRPATGGDPVSLRDHLVFASGRGALAAAHLALPPGPYILREPPGSHSPGAGDALPIDAGEAKADRVAPAARNQLVFLPEGRQAQVLLHGTGTLLRSFTYSLADGDQVFDPRSEDAVAAAATLQALAHDQAEALISANPKIEALLSREHANPWLGVLAAYALELGDGLGSDREKRLRGQLRQFLLRTLPDHPDVLALYGSGDGSRSDTPPMLRAGLRRLMAVAAHEPGLRRPGSLVDRVAANLIVDSPWTAWPDFAANSAEAAAPPPSSDAALLQAVLPASAPIFAVGSSSPSAKNVARDVVLATTGFELLQQLDSQRAGPESGARIGKVAQALEQITPESISGLTGLSFDAAAAGLESLKAIASGAASPIPSAGPDPLGVEVLRLSVREVLGEDPWSGVEGRSLEDDARELTGRAAELEAADVPGAAEFAARARAVAEKLLGRAHLLVATDEEDRPVLANGAVQALSASLTSIGADLPWLAGAAAPSEGWLKTEVRSAVGDLVGFIHSRPADAAGAAADLSGLRAVLPSLNLQTALWLDGDAARRNDYRAAVETLLDRCDQLLS